MHPRRRPFPRACWLILAGLASGCANFGVVEEGRVYRSGQPEADNLRTWVDQHDLKTILQLRGVKPSPAAAEVIEQAEIEVVRIPLSARSYPNRAQLVQLWDTFAQARYPMLIHCRAGADRTGLAAAIYTLQRTGDLDRARAQLSLAHGHTGYGTNRLDRVFEMYGRWHGRMDFRRWASTLYHPPQDHPARKPKKDAALAAGSALLAR